MKLKVQVLGGDSSVNGRPVVCRFGGGEVPVVDAASTGGIFAVGNRTVVAQLDVQGGNARFRSEEAPLGGGTADPAPASASSESGPRRRLCLAVVDKGAGTIKISPLAAVVDLRLHAAEASHGAPSAPTSMLDKARDAATAAARQEKGYTEKRNELVQTFGAARQARAVRSLQANRLDHDKLTTTEVNAVLRSVETSQTPPPGLGAARHSVLGPTAAAAAAASGENAPAAGIPPHDLKAQAPATTYPLRGIITPAEWHDLERNAREQAAKANGDTPSGETPSGGSHPALAALWHPLAHVLREATKNGTNMTSHYLDRWMALTHMEQLLTFKVNPEGVLKGELLPPATNDKCRAKFVEAGMGGRGIRMPDRLRDKMIYHVLALWLHVVDFGGDPRDVAAALGLEEIRTLVYLKHLGCQVRRVRIDGTKRFYAELVVPLTFPPLVRRQLRKSM